MRLLGEPHTNSATFPGSRQAASEPGRRWCRWLACDNQEGEQAKQEKKEGDGTEGHDISSFCCL